MSDTVRTDVYLQVAPEWLQYAGDRDNPAYLRGIRVVNHTQKRSKRPAAGTVEVKITIEIPKAAFIALRPEAVVVIPESLTQPHPVTVEATDPTQED